MTKDELIAATTAAPDQQQDLAPTKENAKRLGLTKDELIAATTSPQGAPQPGQPGSPYPANPKLLDPRPDDSWDWAQKKGALTAAGRVLTNIPGMVGNAREMVDLGAAGLASGYDQVAGAVGLPQTEDADKTWRDRYEANRKMWPEFVQQIPTGEDIYQGYVRPYVGQYDPVSPGFVGQAGRMAQTGLEALLTPNPATIGKTLTGKAARNAGLAQLGQAASGAVAQKVGEDTGNPFAAMAAGIAVPLAANVAAEGVRTRVLPSGRETAAQDVAANVVREAPRNPNAVMDSPAKVPRYNPTTPNLLRDEGVAALSKKLGASDEMGAASEQNTKAWNTEAQSQTGALGSAAEGARQAALGTVDAATQGQVSGRTNAIVSTMRDADKQAERAKWDDWRQTGGGIYFNKVRNGITDYFNNLPEGDAKRAMKQVFQDGMTNFRRSMNGKVADPGAWQDTRSKLLEMARDTESATDAKMYGAAADRIRDVMIDKGNYLFGDKKGSVQKWNDAVAATKKYHDDWGNKFNRVASNPELAPEALLDRTFRSADSPQRTRELMSAVGQNMGLVNQFHDWHLSELTKGGGIVSPKQVDAYIAKNYDTIKQIPGLEQKLQTFKNLSGDQQMMSTWERLRTQSPDNFIRFVDKNRSTLDALATKAGNKPQMDEIEKAARQLQALAPKGEPGGDTIKGLTQHGRLGTLLYGSSLPGHLGAAAMTALGAIAGLSGHGLVGLTGEVAMGALGVAGGLGGHRIGHWVDNAVTSGIRERAKSILQEALADPEKWKELQNRPKRETVQKLFGGLTSQATGAAVGTHEGLENANEPEQ